MKAQSNSFNSLVYKIANLENLFWAWQKAKNAYRVGDIWFDSLELAYFEANTFAELSKISKLIISGNFKLDPILPIPFPKGEKYDDESGEIIPKVRQTFYISVKDQVIWLAVINIIGPKLDFEMPFWSYGNRLYYSIWYEDDKNGLEDRKVLKTGWYRSSTKYIFRAWRHSWPLYRHTIALTIKKMSKVKNSDYSDKENDLDKNNEYLPKKLKANYLDINYWNNVSNTVNKLYWASIDFEKFYPNLRIDIIIKNINKYILDCSNDIQFQDLLKQLTSFKVSSKKYWTKNYKKEINLKLDKKKQLKGIPTGLYVAGFLANVALLDIDKKVNIHLNKNRNIAHFRYVDDHVILAYNFNELKEWIKIYKKIIHESSTGVIINDEKTEPKELAEYFKPNILNCKCKIDREKFIKNLELKAKKSCILDSKFPTPLVTQTLAKVSNIADCDIDFLTEQEERQLISDLEHLLITDFPEHELKSDTRVSFAASMLTSIMPKKRIDYSEVFKIRREIYDFIQKFRGIDRNDSEIESYSKYLISKYLFDDENLPNMVFSKNHHNNIRAQQIFIDIEESHKDLRRIIADIEDRIVNQKIHIFKLLVKAAKDNHDKVKLWSRLIDYSFKTGILGSTSYKPLLSIIDAIKEVREEGKSHELSHNFLISQFILVLSDRLTYALYVLINDEDYIKRINAELFINACIDDCLLDKLFNMECDSIFDFYKKSFKLFRMTLGTTMYFYNCNTINGKYNVIDWNKDPIAWCKKYKVDMDKYLYFLMYKLNDKKKSSCFSKWIELAMKSINPNPFIRPFTNQNLINHSNIESEFISLTEWIQFCNLLERDNNNFDPRLSEWMALKIVHKLIEIYITKKNNSAEAFLMVNCNNTNIKIHPSNFFIPKNWTLESPIKSWNFYRSEFDFSKVCYKEEAAVFDTKYEPHLIVESYKTKNEDFAPIFSFAIILSQLIAHDNTFPWVWNVENKNIEHSTYILSTLDKTIISSHTKAIILACTSSRSRESFMLRSVFDEYKGQGISDDSKNDPPNIVTLSDLSNYIEKVIRILEGFQTSVGENKPRQMIPIKLRRLTENQNY